MKIHSRCMAAFTPEKQAALDQLCIQLLKNQALITSGKLQFIGLAKIKKRMGRQWEGLSKIVYDTAEAVIDQFLDKGDVFIRYRDDTYIMIFARSTLEESRIKGDLIAVEIQKRLFALDEKELRTLEIRQALSEIHVDAMGMGFPDFLDSLFPDDEDCALNPFKTKKPDPDENLTPYDVKTVDVDTANYRPEHSTVRDENALTVEMNFSYSPLWEIRRNALTSYLCLAHSPAAQGSLFQAYKSLYAHRNPHGKAVLDNRILAAVAAELERMAADGRKLLLICPVQHETLYLMENYESFKNQLLKIPPAQRQYLILLVMNIEDAAPPKNAYWFAAPLRQYCRHVFAEIPLRRDINFNYLRNSGVDVAGVRLDRETSEQETISLLNAFCIKSKSLKIAKTFILDVSTLSLATSAACAGFDFLGGAVIDETRYPRPQEIRRYRAEDLVSHLLKK
ncbi:MAG: hypothetical protein ACXW30_05140 [Micavibrio sp.]